MFEVYVDNIGCVYSGQDSDEANNTARYYADDYKADAVYVFADGNLVQEYEN